MTIAFKLIKNLALALVLSMPVAAPLLADGGANHQTEQPRPIPLGVSGGNINDISRAFCCGGTLGALVQNSAGTQFILSNNHVLARTNQASAGEDIIQPGLIDQETACLRDADDAVADLSAFVPISFKRGTTNKVDAAIAQTRSGAVSTDGNIMDIGQVSTSINASPLGVAVKKSGRTTGLTTGQVTAVNVTVDVTYNKQCGIGSQTARFVGQIAIEPGTFSAGGDSGSLIVENIATCPRPVGLLFAGSSSVTIANPIADVLSAFNVGIVGCSSSGGASPSSSPAIDPASLAAASAVKARHEDALFRIAGVVGTGVGLSDTPGQALIEVYVEAARPDVLAAIPSHLEGIPVRVKQTGRITAY